MVKRVAALGVIAAVATLVSAKAGAQAPITPTGKSVKPTVSYYYLWFSTTDQPGIVRVPINGKRRFTLRTNGNI
jgi:hypothetical protein